MQSFVLDASENPYNVVEPGKRPRATLTPGMALKDGRPYLSFAVQGGDSQDQNLLQFFLNVVEFGMNVQESVEAANINSFQMHGSFGEHETRPGRILLHDSIPSWVRSDLRGMDYAITFGARTSGPITAIFFDREHGTLWGGAQPSRRRLRHRLVTNRKETSLSRACAYLHTLRRIPAGSLMRGLLLSATPFGGGSRRRAGRGGF